MKVLTAGTCMLLYAFAVVRAIRVPLTFDEAAAFLRYIDTDFPSVFHTSLLSIFSFEVATNHFLNTLLTKLCYLAAGSSELALRTPNLIGYAIYLCFAQLILRRCTDRTIALAGFLLLNLNPYLLDFFTASRGYGLSVGLLLGALYFLFQVLDAVRDGASPIPRVSWMLALACAAVLANFALLNAYVGIFAIAFVGLLVVRSHGVSPPLRDTTPGRSATEPVRSAPRVLNRVPWLPIVAVTFTALVLSQDLGLSSSLYEDVSVSVAGLDASELDAIAISRIDIRGREARLRRDVGAMTWRVNGRVPVQALRIELPERLVANLTTIETIVGSHEILYHQRRPVAWNSRVLGNTHVFESTPSLSLPRSRLNTFKPIINWAGDRTYVSALGRSTATALAILALLAVILRTLGSFAARRNLLPVEQWRPLASGMLWLAALAGTPLFLLRRDSQLYFGGTHGLIADTFYSIVENSFYGRKYHPAQIPLVLALVLATVAGFIIVAAVSYRRRAASSMLPGALLLALLVLISAGLVAQHLLFGTVYLVGRTALFYIPLYVLFLTFGCDALARIGRAARGFARAGLVAAASLSALHFITTANARFTFDWQDDASTKMMISDLTEMIGAERPPRTHATLAVTWIYAPVSIYYAHRRHEASIDVAVRNAPGGTDFFYAGERSGGAGMTIVRRYPFTRTALMAPRSD
jgi:hypothetical protein